MISAGNKKPKQEKIIEKMSDTNCWVLCRDQLEVLMLEPCPRDFFLIVALAWGLGGLLSAGDSTGSLG